MQFDQATMLRAAQRAFSGRRQPNPALRPWKPGVSPAGGSAPAKLAGPPPVPQAPGVGTRISPGSVPPRKRGYRPEMMP